MVNATTCRDADNNIVGVVGVTSSIYYSTTSVKANGITTKAQNIIDNGDGTSNIQFDEAVTLPVITQEEEDESSVEIALLSRNIDIRGEEGESGKGGYMQILHTPSIPLTIEGVEFTNMGRLKEVDRFVS